MCGERSLSQVWNRRSDRQYVLSTYCGVTCFQIWWMINIIDMPLFALFWVRNHAYLYLGPSEIYSFHIVHLDLSILRHFLVVWKQLVKVVWRALNFVLRRWLATMPEVRDGFLNYLGCLSYCCCCLDITSSMTLLLLLLPWPSSYIIIIIIIIAIIIHHDHHHYNHHHRHYYHHYRQ